MKAPSSKLQVPRKLQVPNSKTSLRFDYPFTGEAALLLNETPSDKRAAVPPFDLGERTAQFGEAIVRFSKTIPRDPTNNRLIDQLVGCGTSIGANYCEANEGVSKKDFKYSIGRCVKEAKETKFFLRMIAASEPNLAGEARRLYREAKELLLILASMYRK
jgi:four helix bundle protein